MKDKILGTLGAAGFVVWYIAALIISILPWIVMPFGFLITSIGIAICYFVPILNIPAWLVGFYYAVTGPQDFWAFLYYAVAGIAAFFFILDFVQKRY